MLTFWELAPSPNSVKVHAALRFKKIEFEALPVDPADRAALLEASGQPLAPVIRDHGVVLHDSEAILHFLDANYRDRPRLYPADREGRARADAWKRELDERVARHWLPVFRATLGFADSFDPAELERYHEALAWLDETIGDRDHVRGDDAPVNDLRVAEWAVYALPGDALCRRVHLFRTFRERFAVEPGRFPNLERFLAPWQERLG